MRFVRTDLKAFPLFEEKFSHLAPQNPPPEATSTEFEHWTLGGSRTRRMQPLFSFKQKLQPTDCICSLITKQTLSNHWHNGKECLEFRNGVLTSTMALGRSSALNSCSMESIMFFQPSLRMLPCRWARSNTVLAAVCALLLLPNTVGRFSTDCRERGHTNTQSTDILTQLLHGCWWEHFFRLNSGEAWVCIQ